MTASAEAPIEIVEYDDTWPRRFFDEQLVIRAALAPWLAGPIEHIGSTAVPELAAKPVVDIMAAVASLDESRPAIDAASAIGYCYAPYRPEDEHWFCKPSFALRTFHLHLVPLSSEQWSSTLAFRDYLRAHRDVALEYERLKRELAARYRHDREAYTEAKRPFILRIVQRALDERAGRG